MTAADLARLVDVALDDCRITLGPRTRRRFVDRLAELLEGRTSGTKDRMTDPIAAPAAAAARLLDAADADLDAYTATLRARLVELLDADIPAAVTPDCETEV
jgi:hypothetical protein